MSTLLNNIKIMSSFQNKCLYQMSSLQNNINIMSLLINVFFSYTLPSYILLLLFMTSTTNMKTPDMDISLMLRSRHLLSYCHNSVEVIL